MKHSWGRYLLSGAAGAALLSACSDDPDPAESLGPAAEQLAQALQQADLEGVALSSGDAESLSTAAERLHESLEELSLEVEVAETDIDLPEEDSPRAPTAEITYRHTWELDALGVDDEDWDYTTEAELNYHEESETWYLDADYDLFLPGYQGHEEIGISTTGADRGRIMDGEGRAMVYNRDVVVLGVDKTQFGEDEDEEMEASARELAETVGIGADAYVEQVEAYGEEAFVEAITVRRDGGHVTVEDVESIRGVHWLESEMSLADSSDFAPLLLGRVGPVTAEHMEEDPALQVGDMVGTSGVQGVHEQTLRGTPGVRIYRGEETLYSTDPETGEDVRTSLHPRLQNLAQEIMEDQDTGAGMVAIRPSDGGILAAASHSPDESAVEAATQSAYAPGSTFKMVSSLAMLRDGLSAGSTVSCPSSVTVHGQQFTNVSGYEHTGSLSFADAVAHSCNTVFAAAHEDVSAGDLREAALDLGINNDVGIGVHAMKGSLPEEAELNEHAANLFGQGTVETSALGMAAVTSSIADGRTVHPWLVEGAGEPDDDAETGEGLTEEEGEQMRALMEGTVPYGTLDFLDPIPGDHVYAKTGTAESGEDLPHTWVIGFQGDLAVAIFLEEGEWGSTDNGPLLREFLIGAQDILND
ncbi:penicillin-binding transpeptidase domain-containing protein [Nesterenkonia populi]|uniref:penicillin-binding transpeptidase domain-containing protein n=1 Tax=Nesterenkonia populi TaxID=1591087 RepID=UPI0011BEFCB1|nr:penicillin-binding transpeptidase domain-containing protein [Nesterenkonia populi]